MFKRLSFPVLFAIIVAMPAWPGSAQSPCDKINAVKISGVEIAAIRLVTAGPHHEAVPATGVAPLVLPAYCAVEAIARPTSDSFIKIEIWLPIKDWNGNYRQVGNGGWAGSIYHQGMAEALSRGYATAGTDDGHQSATGFDASWAIGHPEKLIDFGYRSLHETRSVALALIGSFYGKQPKWKYFTGASGGGREALMIAQRYPEDFDGIVAGCPVNYWSEQFADFVWNWRVLSEHPIPLAKLPAIQKAALDACDKLDGVEDGLIENPAVCHFDPKVLTCKGSDGPDCLTPGQVSTLSAIYAGLNDSKSGKKIALGFPPGTENISPGWDGPMIGADPSKTLQMLFATGYYANAVHESKDWQIGSFQFDRDITLADQKAGTVIDATNPDLRSFRAHGGKLIQYHGWGDPLISPLGSPLYYEHVRDFLKTYPDPRSDTARPIQDFYRLFMVPGMSHGGGGIGANLFGQVGSGTARQDREHDVMTALEDWVEKGVPPDRIIASGKAPKDPSKAMTHPLCPYPAVARYKGTGDPYSAENFECVDEQQ